MINWIVISVAVLIIIVVIIKPTRIGEEARGPRFSSQIMDEGDDASKRLNENPNFRLRQSSRGYTAESTEKEKRAGKMFRNSHIVYTGPARLRPGLPDRRSNNQTAVVSRSRIQTPTVFMDEILEYGGEVHWSKKSTRIKDDEYLEDEVAERMQRYSMDKAKRTKTDIPKSREARSFEIRSHADAIDRARRANRP